MIQVGAEREIKFDRTLRYKRQQDYDIMDYDLDTYEFASGERKVYRNLNFSIFVDDYCNADCKFCVAQLRYAHRSRIYDKKSLFKAGDGRMAIQHDSGNHDKRHIREADGYLARLEEVLKVVRPLNPSVSITGGEPTISPLLPEILRLVDKYGFRKRTITTNGSGLLLARENDTILGHLIRNGWNHLNISRTHYDDDINKSIMRYGQDKEYCSIPMLKEILETVGPTALKHRLSCLLLKEGVGTVEDMKRYIDFYGELGADNFIFRELMNYDSTAVNQEKMRYCDENKVRLDDIWEEMEGDAEFKPYLNLVGYYYYVEIYKYRGMTVASESADLNQQYVEKKKHGDIVYEMIFHNNGNLCGSWIDDEEILDEYQRR